MRIIQQALCMLDQLTQLPNRRFMETQIINGINEFENNNSKMALLFFDIDHFKNFNNTYGHDVGDLVLNTVANTFKNNLRDNDIIGRWGGEEFIGAFYRVHDTEYKDIAERMRILVENTLITLENGKNLSISVSVGATVVREGDNFEAIVKRADKLMYESKINGRNRVTSD